MIGSSRASAYALSAILAVAIAVSLSIIVFYWIQGISSGQAIASSILNDALRSEERFEIHEVAFDRNLTEVGLSERGLITYVANSGSVSVKLVSVYVNGESTSTIPSNLTLEPNEVGTIYIPYSWSEGESYEVKVASSRGTQESSTFSALGPRIVD